MIKANQYPGSNTKDNYVYHDCDLCDKKSHRKNTQMRVDLITDNYDVKGKSGVDLGCNIGAFCFKLTEAGAVMTGIDYDKQIINIAKDICKTKKINIDFMQAEINLDFIVEIPLYSFAIFFDCWMWIEKKHGMEYACKLLYELSRSVDTLFFSTSQNDGMARNNIKTADNVEFLLIHNTVYKNIEKLGAVKDGWHNRTMFKCY